MRWLSVLPCSGLWNDTYWVKLREIRSNIYPCYCQWVPITPTILEGSCISELSWWITGALRVADRCLYAWWHVSFVYSLLKVPLCAETYARCIVYRSLLNFNLIFGTSSWLFWMVCLLNRLSPNIEIFFFSCCLFGHSRAKKIVNISGWKTELLSPTLQAYWWATASFRDAELPLRLVIIITVGLFRKDSETYSRDVIVLGKKMIDMWFWRNWKCAK